MFKNKYKNYFKNAFCMLLITCLISTTVIKADAAVSVLEEARNVIKNYYVEDVSDETLNADTVEEMVKRLGDKYSQYFTASEFESFTNSINNTFVGIGIRVDSSSEGVKVVQVFDKSPAYENGLKEGDIITEADGHNLAGLTVEEAINYVKGPEGTKVSISVKRGNELLNFHIERRQISVPTVVSKILDGDIGYVSISSFGENTGKEFENAIKYMKGKSVKRYIFDLRGNPGGYLYTALFISGYFIGNNDAVIVENKEKLRIHHKGITHNEIITEPSIFLVDEMSASASEVLSAAVKDYGKAYFIGRKTFGKGTVQSPFMLSDGSVIKLTIQRFLSPKGNVINKVGVSPDFEVNNKDIDPLLIAELLYGNSGDINCKTGYLKIKIDGKNFEIDLNKTKDSKYVDAYRTILEKANKDEIYIGTDKGWQKAEYKNGLITIINTNFIKNNEASKKVQPPKKVLKKVTVKAKIRSKASSSSKVIATLSKGTNVEILSYKNGWYRINYKGNPAYIYGKYVK